MNVDDLLEARNPRAVAIFVTAVSDWVVAEIRSDGPAIEQARLDYANSLRSTAGVAELLGAQEIAQLAAGVYAQGMNFGRERRHLLAFAEQTIVPSVTFEELIEDVVSRAPVTVVEAVERTAARIAELYSQDRVLAFARSAEEQVTQRAADFLRQAFAEGLGEDEAARGLRLSVDAVREATGPWSQDYAKTVFRTNLNTATTAGRFRQAADPAIRQVLPAFEYDAVGDRDTRRNHEAADGLILTVDNPAWAQLAPPLGYNCRCQVRAVPLPELQQRRRIDADFRVIESQIPAGAAPDPGFRKGGRPDLAGLQA